MRTSNLKKIVWMVFAAALVFGSCKCPSSSDEAIAPKSETSIKKFKIDQSKRVLDKRKLRPLTPLDKLRNPKTGAPIAVSPTQSHAASQPASAPASSK